LVESIPTGGQVRFLFASGINFPSTGEQMEQGRGHWGEQEEQEEQEAREPSGQSDAVTLARRFNAGSPSAIHQVVRRP
jgi:hypothetical protein